MKYSLCEDFLNSNKILYPVIERICDYKKGNRNFMPWSVEIQPTAQCNHRCIHCSYEERNQNRDFLSQPSMESLIDSIISMGVKGVYFSGGGEPCVYPDLAKYINRLCDNEIEVALLTNGTMLKNAGIYEIADRLNYIAVSVPSCVRDNFKKITGVDKLETVINVAKDIKNIHGENSPVIGARVIVTNLIIDEIEIIFNILKNNKFDYVLYKIVRDYEDRGLGVNEEKALEVKERIDAMMKQGLLDEKFTNLNHVFDYRKTVQFTGKCFVNDMGLLANISPEGEVYANITEIGKKDFCIGNINNKPLQEIWNSERHNQIKDLSNSTWKTGKCKNCRAITYNKIIENLNNSMPRFIDSFI
jgi:radical SAM protein with 4Fe4S-binding SPASM domain